jgi:hypothetical protein
MNSSLIASCAFLGAVYLGVIGLYIADAKGRSPVEGIALALLAGPIGWLIVAALPAVPRAAGDDAGWANIPTAPPKLPHPADDDE